MGKVQRSSIDQAYIVSKKLSKYQNSEILWCLNAIALSNFYMYIKSLQV